MAVGAGTLPVEDVLGELAAALDSHGAAVLAAPPGAGKSTRIPLALLPAPWLAGRRIVLLEPRRLAARAVAERMAATLGEAVGATVGYRMRGDTRVTEATRIEVVTEGVLTRLLQSDPALSGVGLVIFDEFHERSLDADLGLAFCLEARAALTPELRLLVMSATLDLEPVAKLLGVGGRPAPMVRSEGRQHPVATQWQPLVGNQRWDVAVARLVAQALTETHHGDVLVFLPGAADIRRLSELLAVERNADHDLGDSVVVLALHGGLSWEEQDRALAPDRQGRRKVLLATSIAETSLTIDGVSVVVDAGRSRVPRFDARRGVGRLETVPVSVSSADQRRGRAGRQGPGSCYRLWSEADHASLASHHEAEILIGDLAPLALELARWGSPDGAGLAWLDPPPPGHLLAGRELLERLGFVDKAGRLTEDGRRAAKLGAHPRIGRLLVGPVGGAAQANDGDRAVACALAALLGDRDPFGQRATTADVRERLAAIDRFPRLQQEARRLARRVGLARLPRRLDLDRVGAVLARAYPDRLAVHRSGTSPRYRLANGRGAALQDADPLGREKLLVVVDLDGAVGRMDGLIRLAAPLDEADLPGDVVHVDRVMWDATAGDVRGRRERIVAGLTLSSSPLASLPSGEAVAALLDGIAGEGLSLLSESKARKLWRQRVLFCRRVLGEDWPDVSEPALLATLAEWLGPYLVGCRRRGDLAGVDLDAALEALVPFDRRRQLSDVAPVALVVPSGREVTLDYGNDPPILAVKLQECFGWTATPTVAGGRIPVLLHLLSPAGRPVAITADLASFWAGPYSDVRRELRGRYPKHRWPEDPLTAEPGRR